MKLAPVVHLHSRVPEHRLIDQTRTRRPGARETQVAWRQVHFAAKSAPQHRDFAAGKVEAIK